MHDVIVLGTGGIGSAALYQLAKRGVRVLGLDRFEPGHDRGSSHGQSRIIRQAYFEHRDYVPLLLEAYRLWAELEERRQEKLVHQIGILEIGPPDGAVVPGVLGSAEKHGLEVEELSAEAVARRWPQMRVPPGNQAVFEPKAGWLPVEKCVVAHLEEAQKLGAELKTGVSVQDWKCVGDRVEVTTDAGVFTADRLIIAAGAWSDRLLHQVGVPLEVRRKPLFWFETNDPHWRVEQGATTFLYERPDGVFYGFPALDEPAVKVAEHSGGHTVSDPLTVNREIDERELARVVAFVRDVFPSVSDKLVRHAVCMYTMTPDENFLVDRHPAHEQVVFCAGLSGHGFKFASVLGAVLADLAVDGATKLPIDFLRLDRFATR